MLPYVIGAAAGVILWLVAVRPIQLNEHERRRRDAGLPAKRELPED